MSLEVICGCMFSGKSTELINRIRKHQSIGKRTLVIKYIKDTRYHVTTEESFIISHDLVKVASIPTNLLNDVDIKEFDSIFIEEGQFFDDLVEFATSAVEIHNKYMCVSGLDGDFQRKPFMNMAQLIPLCDKLTRLSAYCQVCANGTPAIFSKRTVANNNTILIGEKNAYIPVCRKHYLI